MRISRYNGLDSTPVDRLRQFLVVVDNTPESRTALRYACVRAAHTLGGSIMLLSVAEPTGFMQWGGVQSVMEAEARAEAEAILHALASELAEDNIAPPVLRIEVGKTADVVLQILSENSDICALVLAASAQGDPGPLVAFFSGKIAGSLPCPVIIVPGALSADGLDALA